MSNPALELAEILDSWAVQKGQTIHQARGNEANTSSLPLWDEVIKAVRCLVALDKILQAMAARGDDITDYRQALPTWWAAVFQPDQLWNAGHNAVKPLISPSDLATLRIFGRLIEAQGLTDQLTPESLESIVLALTEIEDAVGDLDMADLAKHRILWHVQQARMFAADIDRFGEAVVIQTASAVATETVRLVQEERVDASKASKLRRAAAVILANAAGNYVGSGALELTPVILKAIEAATS